MLAAMYDIQASKPAMRNPDCLLDDQTAPLRTSLNSCLSEFDPSMPSWPKWMTRPLPYRAAEISGRLSPSTATAKASSPYKHCLDAHHAAVPMVSTLAVILAKSCAWMDDRCWQFTRNAGNSAKTNRRHAGTQQSPRCFIKHLAIPAPW